MRCHVRRSRWHISKRQPRGLCTACHPVALAGDAAAGRSWNWRGAEVRFEAPLQSVEIAIRLFSPATVAGARTCILVSDILLSSRWCFLVLYRTRESVDEDPTLVLLKSQRAFNGQVREARPPILAHTVLRTGFRRWVAGGPGATFPRLLPGRARSTMSRPGCLPAAVRWAMTRVCLHGVRARGRFKQAGCCDRAEDRVQTWPRCDAIIRAGVRALRLLAAWRHLFFSCLAPDAAAGWGGSKNKKYRLQAAGLRPS